MSGLKHFDIVNYPRHETLRLMASYLQSVIEETDKMPETRNELTRFHAKSIPTIDILAYLNRILKYAPCENDCFLSVLVYFHKMATLQNKPPSFVSSCKKRRKPIIINSYNIHRLLIIGIMVAAKFYSDIFFTNSHYAKVGGLPVIELNQLEIEFLLINDFDLHISVEEIQETGDLLISHALKYPLHVGVKPQNEAKKIHKHNSQKLPQKDIPVPPRVQLNEAEESNRRISMQPQSAVSTVSSNNGRTGHNYNIQFTNSPQPKHATSSYDEYNRDIESTAAAIDSFDGEPLPKFTTLSSVSKNGHRSPIPNVYTLARTTSKSASAKLRNSMIMSMNSNIPLSSNNNSISNNNSNNSTVSSYSTINDNVSMMSQNSGYNNRYSYQQHPQQQQQPPQQILQHNIYQTPPTIQQNPPPNGILMDSQYTMYEAQQKSQELMKKYNDNLRMNANMGNGQGNGMMYKQLPATLPPKTFYTSPESTEPIPLNNSMMSGAGSYSTSELYNNKRMSTHSYTAAANNKMSVYKHPAKSKSSSSLNVVNNDWHNKELPPINVTHKTGSSSNLRALCNGNPHSANEVIYQQQMQGQPPKAVPPMYNNSPINMNGVPPQDKRSSRLSVNHAGSQFSIDSPMDAPPRLTKFFGYMPNEVISPIKITEDFQQDLQKMEDMTNAFYLSPLNPNSSPSITHSFSNLHINSNASSASNTPLRSYNSISNVSTPNGPSNSMMDPGASISPLVAKTSNLSLSPSTPTNNRPFSVNLDPTLKGNIVSSPVSTNYNKHFSIQSVDRGISNLSGPAMNMNPMNKRFSAQPLSLQQNSLQQPPNLMQQPPNPLQQPPNPIQQPPNLIQQNPNPMQQPPLSQGLSINTNLPNIPPRTISNNGDIMSMAMNYNNENGPMSAGSGDPLSAVPNPSNNLPHFMNKPPVNKNYR